MANNKSYLGVHQNQLEYNQMVAIYNTPHVVYLNEEKKLIYKGDPLNGHEYVDLGLPSKTRWATKNVGSNSSSEVGLYFGWGGTFGATAQEIKDGIYSFSPDNMSGGKNLVPYLIPDPMNYDFDNFTKDGGELDLLSDAVHVNMGGDWQLPTAAQCQELIDCTTKELVTDVNGNVSCKFIGEEDKYIIIPYSHYAKGNSITEFDTVLLTKELASNNYKYFKSFQFYIEDGGLSEIKIATQPRINGYNCRGVITLQENNIIN